MNRTKIEQEIDRLKQELIPLERAMNDASDDLSKKRTAWCKVFSRIEQLQTGLKMWEEFN